MNARSFANLLTVAEQAHSRHRGPVPGWLVKLGPLGLFALAVVDSSVVPLPLPGSTDLLLLWMTAHHGNPWLLALTALGGSILGGYLTWSTGKRGGEAALRRYASQRIVVRITGWVKRRSVLSVIVPAMLPPPVPLTPFLLAAGAFGVSRRTFLASFTVARALRYGLIAWLGVTYGRAVVRTWSQYLADWSAPLIWTFTALTAGAVVFAVIRFRRGRRERQQHEPELRPAGVGE